MIEIQKYSMNKQDSKNKLDELEIFKDKVAYEFKDGWTDLVYQLGKDITELCESANCELPMIQQVKEKLGTLRFYYDDSKNEYPKIIRKCMRILVSKAENESASICEICGKKGQLRAKMINKYSLWITTCEEHKEDSLTVEEFKNSQNKHQQDEIISKLKELKPLYKEKGLEIICINDNTKEEYKRLNIYYKLDIEAIEKSKESEDVWLVSQFEDFFDEIKTYFKMEINFYAEKTLFANDKVIYI
jgi:transcription elongation factor Elf1